MSRKTTPLVTTAAAAALLAGCGAGGASGTDGADGEITGTVTVLTNRTDIVDTTLAGYAKEFEALHPGVDVQFEAVTDYEGDVSVRLNSRDYGDVLLIPNQVTKDQLPQFFAPLGSTEELGRTYRFVDEAAYEGEVYGLATFGTAMGYVLNTDVWAEAGITAPPETPEEFLQALAAIDEKTDAIPYYTNYADGWPLAQWQSNQGSIAGPDALLERTRDDAPWTEGKEQHAIDSLLYRIVERGLSEPDPTTTNWEESKNLIGSGEVATMVLGSWAVPQMQEAAEAAGGSADDIGFWPMPWKVDGDFHSTVSGDYKIGISRHSDNADAARAWVDWFLDSSGFAAEQGGLSPRLDGEAPPALEDFEAHGVEQVELSPAPAGEESVLSDIYNTAEIDLAGEKYRQEFLDVARGAAEGDEAFVFGDLNSRWAAARAQVSAS
ncbi:ABC transporter substrate-binding protein [Kineococcus xinjiangensis]|nr:ABC transporter substrate-binding protein [Kineococcus xinjiangensis]